jgi:hypothetical protein
MSNTTLLTTMIPQSEMRACCESGLGFDIIENRFDNIFYYSMTSTSVRSSVYQFVQENGRTYHKYREGSKSSLYVQSHIFTDLYQNTIYLMTRLVLKFSG